MKNKETKAVIIIIMYTKKNIFTSPTAGIANDPCNVYAWPAQNTTGPGCVTKGL